LRNLSFLTMIGDEIPRTGSRTIGTSTSVFCMICGKKLKTAPLSPDTSNYYGRKRRYRNLNRGEKRGYRAEVRRERKKRDILSPVNVLQISYLPSEYQYIRKVYPKQYYFQKKLPIYGKKSIHIPKAVKRPNFNELQRYVNIWPVPYQAKYLRE